MWNSPKFLLFFVLFIVYERGDTTQRKLPNINRNVHLEIWSKYNETTNILKFSNATRNCYKRKNQTCTNNLYKSICLRGKCVSLWSDEKLNWEILGLRSSAVTTSTTETPKKYLNIIRRKKVYGVGRKFNDYGLDFEDNN